MCFAAFSASSERRGQGLWVRAAGCMFCGIVAGEVPSHVVFEDEVTVALLDRRPVFPGYALLVPKEHVETLVDLPDGLLGPLFSNGRLLAAAMERGLGAHGSFVAINNRVNQSVPQHHVHAVPRRRKDGLRGFFWPRQKYDNEIEVRDAIRGAVAELSAARGSGT